MLGLRKRLWFARSGGAGGGRSWPGGDTEARLRIRQVFASLLAGLCKSTLPIFVKFGGKVARGPRKKPLNFAGNPGLHPDLGSF